MINAAILIGTLALVAGGAIIACVRETRLRKKEKETFKKFVIDTSEW